jgi:DNA-binding MurR/RpiR family transcriptional regulator
VEGMQRAKAAGTYCVGITDTYLSPLAQYADEFFLASVGFSLSVRPMWLRLPSSTSS